MWVNFKLRMHVSLFTSQRRVKRSKCKVYIDFYIYLIIVLIDFLLNPLQKLKLIEENFVTEKESWPVVFAFHFPNLVLMRKVTSYFKEHLRHFKKRKAMHLRVKPKSCRSQIKFCHPLNVYTLEKNHFSLGACFLICQIKNPIL